MVKWTETARANLRQIFDYINGDSSYYARKVVTKIVDKAEILNEFPEMGRMVPEIMNTNIRELIVFSCRIIYENSQGEIKILAVIHGKRNFDDAFDVS